MLYYSFRVQSVLSVMSGFAALSIIGIDLHHTKTEVHMMSSLIEAIAQLWYDLRALFIEALAHYGTIRKANSPLGYLVSTFHSCRTRHHGSAISHFQSIVTTPIPVEYTVTLPVRL